MKVVRNYVYKGVALGAVEFEAPEGAFKLNGQTLPVASVQHLLNFALQTLQDAYAGAKSPEEAKGSFEKKRDKLIDGSIGVRVGGGGESEDVRVRRQIVKAVLLKKLTGKQLEAFKALEGGELNAKLDAAYEKNEAVFKPHVERRLEELRVERERKAQLASLTADIKL